MYEKLLSRLYEGDRFAKMSRYFHVRGSSWTHQQLKGIAKGAPVIWSKRGWVRTGPFHRIEEYGAVKDAGFSYASVYVKQDYVELITATEFKELFFREWSFWRRLRWDLFREWT